jgi:hypothetical protein
MNTNLKIWKISSLLFTVLLTILLTSCIVIREPNQPGIDLPGITVKPTGGLLTTESGGTDSFKIVLDSEPSSAVTIAINCNDTTEGTLSTSSLVFTKSNWNRLQKVTITGVDDAVADGNKSCSITTSPAVSTDPDYNGIDADDVFFTNVDDDTPGIMVNPTSGLVTTEIGGIDSFIVMLNSEPFVNVTLELSSSDPTEGTVNPNSLTFTSEIGKPLKQ